MKASSADAEVVSKSDADVNVLREHLRTVTAAASAMAEDAIRIRDENRSTVDALKEAWRIMGERLQKSEQSERLALRNNEGLRIIIAGIHEALDHDILDGTPEVSDEFLPEVVRRLQHAYTLVLASPSTPGQATPVPVSLLKWLRSECAKLPRASDNHLFLSNGPNEVLLGDIRAFLKAIS